MKGWLATHADDPGCFVTLSWSAGRTYAVHDACLRALRLLGGAQALDAFVTYRGRDAGNKTELGVAWDRFDRREFARRVLASPVTLCGRGERGLERLDGLDAVEALQILSVTVADGCSLEPIARCEALVSVQLFARGDLELAPIARLPRLDCLTVLGTGVVTAFEPLAGARARKVRLPLPAEHGLGFLEALPRLWRVLLTSPRTTVSAADRTALGRLVARGVEIAGYSHEPWTDALREVGGTFSEEAGRRAVGQRPLTEALGNFLSG